MSSEKSIYQNPIFILVLATITCFLWGSAFPSIKIGFSMLGIEHANSIIKLQFAGYRFFLAGIYLLVLILVLKKPLSIPKRVLPYLILLGLLQTALQYYLFYNGLANVTGVKGSIISSLGTFFAVILPHFYYQNEKWSSNKMFGLALGFIGIIYVNLSKGSIDSDFSFYGEGFLILGALISAGSSILAKEVSKKVNSLVMTSYQMLIGSSVMILFSWSQTGGNVIQFNTKIMPLFLYLALISAVGFSLWFLLLSHNKVSHISIYRFQIPIWGSILSAIFLPNEKLSMSIFIALLLVCAGIFLVNKPSKQKLS